MFLHRVKGLDVFVVCTAGQLTFIGLTLAIVFFPPVKCMVTKQTLKTLFVMKTVFLGMIHRGYTVTGDHFDFADATIAISAVIAYLFILFQMIRVAAYLSAPMPGGEMQEASQPSRNTLNARFNKEEAISTGSGSP